MAKREHTVVMPDGTISTRMSAHEYTWAVITRIDRSERTVRVLESLGVESVALEPGETIVKREYQKAWTFDGESHPAEFYLSISRTLDTPRWALKDTTWHRRHDLALKEVANGYRARIVGERIAVKVSSVRVIESRERVRCTGLNRRASSNGWVRYTQCLKDAMSEAGLTRCDAHATQDGEVFKAQIHAEQDAYNAREQAAWDARHAEEFTAATCRLFAGQCRIHSTAEVK